MVTHTDDALNLVFAALADPTRRAILARLQRSEAAVGELAQPFAISRPAVSKHLDVLERAGLIQRVADGRVNRCRFNGAPLEGALELMEEYRTHWDAQLDALTNYLEREGRDGE